MASWLLPVALTAGSGLLNMLSNYSAKKEQEERINKYKGSLEKLKLTDSDRYNKLFDLERMINAEATDVANSSLIEYAMGDVRNTSNLRSKLAAKLLGEKAKLTTELNTKMDAHNKEIELKQAEAELGSGNYSFAQAISDIGTGAIAGYQLSETLKLLNKYVNEEDNKTDTNNQQTNNIQSDNSYKVKNLRDLNNFNNLSLNLPEIPSAFSVFTSLPSNQVNTQNTQTEQKKEENPLMNVNLNLKELVEQTLNSEEELIPNWNIKLRMPKRKKMKF